MYSWPELRTAYQELFGKPPTALTRAPGRINLLGEHIDYNGGIVLPIAIEHELRAAIGNRNDTTFDLCSAQESHRYTGPLPQNNSGLEWTAYVFGVVHQLLQRGARASGFNLLVDSDVPVQSGLSSSAAIGVAAGLALKSLWDFPIAGLELAKLVQQSENEFVGVRCGLMDQAVVVLAARDHVLQLDCANLSFRNTPLTFARPTSILVAHSGVRRGLSVSEYNSRRAECEEALAIINRAHPGRPAQYLCQVPQEFLDPNLLPPVLLKRARHVVGEQSRVRDALSALRNGESEQFGRLLNASHQSLRSDYEVSCPELDELTEWLRAQEGVAGTRLTGAGFGGCTVSLVDASQAAKIIEKLTQEYYPARKLAPLCFISRPSEGATEVIP